MGKRSGFSALMVLRSLNLIFGYVFLRMAGALGPYEDLLIERLFFSGEYDRPKFWRVFFSALAIYYLAFFLLRALLVAASKRR